MNSVDPQPYSSSVKKSTKVVFPFSKQGVILASRTSPFLNLEPEPANSRKAKSATRADAVGRLAISTYAYSLPRLIERNGLILKASETLTTLHPFGIFPRWE